VMLTAALVAGGSNGLAFLIQAIKDQLAPPDPAPVEPAPGQVVAATDPAAQAAGTTSPTPAAVRALRVRMTTTG
jgi:hypothetical protein